MSRGATPPEPALIGNPQRYNLEGFAAGAVTGGGNIPDTDERYRKVTTATELVAALRAAKASTANPVKVIEIMNDLNMGWNEVGTLLQADGLLRQNIAPKKHPALITSGVSLLDIQDFTGLTIFSRNGATIRHAEFNIKNGTNLILRNLRFDELWEWDEGTRGDYDSNDWDFVTIGDGGGVTSGIWVDHCTFTKAYDGVLDIKRGASAITISWSDVMPAATGPGSFVQQQFDDLEINRTSNVMYNFLRGGFTQAQIVDITLPQKKGHLIGSNTLEGLTSYTVTLHHNHYKDLQDRMPRLRGGDVHAYNLYIDSSNARIAKDLRDGIVAANPTLVAALEGASPTYKFGVTSNASISTEGGAVQVESSVYFGVLTPFRNNQTDVTNPVYTGAIRGFDIQHILFASDTQFMPAASQQTFFTDRGFEWASWQGDSDDARQSAGAHAGAADSVRLAQRHAHLPCHCRSDRNAAGVVDRTAGSGRRQGGHDHGAVAQRRQLEMRELGISPHFSGLRGRARRVRVGPQARLATAPALPPLRPRLSTRPELRSLSAALHAPPDARSANPC